MDFAYNAIIKSGIFIRKAVLCLRKYSFLFLLKAGDDYELL
jgi:hypothetical protein